MSPIKNPIEVKINPVRSPRKSPLVPLVLAVSLVTGTILAFKYDILRQIDSTKEGMTKKDNQEQYDKCMNQCEKEAGDTIQFSTCSHNCIDFLPD